MLARMKVLLLVTGVSCPLLSQARKRPTEDGYATVIEEARGLKFTGET